MATLPTPRDWDAFYTPTATDLNDDIRNTVNFFVGPPRVTLRRTANQTITAETWTKITWQSDSLGDVDGMWSSGSLITPITAGRYRVYLSSRWENHVFPVGARTIMVSKNSNGVVASGVEICSDRRRATDFDDGWGTSSGHTTGFVSMNGTTDTFECWVWQGQRTGNIPLTGTPTNADIYALPPSYTSSQTVRFSALWIGQ